MALISLINNAPIEIAVVMGFGLALSSSAFVLQLLSERGEVGTRFGRASVGILLFQDLAVVPLLVVVPLLAAGGGDFSSLLKALGTAAGKAAVAPDVGHIVSFTGTNTFKNDVYPPTDIWRQAECDRGECSQSDVDNQVVRPLSYYGGSGTGEIIYGIEKSTTANDRKVLGSYLMQRPDSPDLTAAVGNHTIWVVDKGANVVVGDWILSSDVAGYAMRDDGSTYDTAYVFAMATENVDWSTVSDVVPGTSTKRKKISVLFERFVRK